MNNFDLIDKYFENSLTPKEQEVFNDLLQNNSKFKEEFMFHKDLKKVVTLEERKMFKKELQKFEDSITNKTKVKPLYKKWLVAASIVLLFSIGLWFVKDNYFPSNTQLYARNFEPYRNIIQPIVRGEDNSTLEYRAFVAYENKECYKAINLFNSLQNTNESYVNFYKAMCYLSLDKTNEAINLLLPISTSINNQKKTEKDLSHIANWYLGLAYLKQGDNQKAISQFSLIVNHPECSYKKKEAKEILKRIS